MFDCERYSSLEKQLKITCFVKRFVRNLNTRVGRGECLEEDSTIAELGKAITPSHPLYGQNIARRNFMYFVTEYCEQDNTLLNKFKRLKTMLSHFKKRFYDEYILSLRERHQYEVKKTNNHPILKINDIVLLKEGKPRIKWWKGKL